MSFQGESGRVYVPWRASPRLTSPPPFYPSARLSYKGAQDPAWPPRVLESQIWDLYHNPFLGAQPKAKTKESLQYLLYVSVGFIWPEVERNFEGF